MPFFPHGMIAYSRSTAGESKWSFYDGNSDAAVGIDYCPPSILDKARQGTRHIQETIKSRILAHPEALLHQKGLISFLYIRAEFEEAKLACVTCLERWPQHWWPNYMLGLIDIKCKNVEIGERRFLKWVEDGEDFHNYYFLAHFYFNAGERKKCRDALRIASKAPIGDWNGGRYGFRETGEHFGGVSSDGCFYDASLMAYELDDLGLCLAICDRWDRFVTDERGYGDPGFRTMRAACYLNQDRLDLAAREIKSVSRANFDSCQGKHVDRLTRAITSKDTRFRYIPDRSVLQQFVLDYQ